MAQDDHEPLQVLLHVSDLHFGIPDVQGNNKFDPRVPGWVLHVPFFDGYLGHTRIGLSRLVDLYKTLTEERDGTPPEIVITGDLTTVGDQTEMTYAEQFFSGKAAIGGGPPIGLSLGQMPLRIPGNHDFWPGNRPTPATVLTCMRGGTKVNTFVRGFSSGVAGSRTLANGVQLSFVTLNTDAAVSPNSSERFFARGSFAQECFQLAGNLGPSGARELRVLLMHHSSIDPQTFALGIDPASGAALTQLITNCGIKMLLTGHRHNSGVGDPTAGSGVSLLPMPISRMCVEARSGTTTQLDKLPRWALVNPLYSLLKKRRLPLNSALVHRIFAARQPGSVVLWTTQEYQRDDPAGGRVSQFVAKKTHYFDL